MPGERSVRPVWVVGKDPLLDSGSHRHVRGVYGEPPQQRQRVPVPGNSGTVDRRKHLFNIVSGEVHMRTVSEQEQPDPSSIETVGVRVEQAIHIKKQYPHHNPVVNIRTDYGTSAPMMGRMLRATVRSVLPMMASSPGGAAAT